MLKNNLKISGNIFYPHAFGQQNNKMEEIKCKECKGKTYSCFDGIICEDCGLLQDSQITGDKNGNN